MDLHPYNTVHHNTTRQDITLINLGLNLVNFNLI
jgi:hypothetical protein